MPAQYRRSILLLVLLFFLAGCGGQAIITPEVVVPATGLTGTISRVNVVVEQGPSADKLVEVQDSSPLVGGDVLKVSGGGEGRLDFGEYLQLRLFNDTKLKTITLTGGENLPLLAQIQLETGGFTGKLAQNGGKAVFETPNGNTITVLGTQFWVAYDEENQAVVAGNFDGKVSLTWPGGSQPIAITPNYYVIARAGQQPEQERPMPMSLVELEGLIRRQKSPVDVFRDEFLAATDTPTPLPTGTPTPTATPTYTPSPTPTSACPPTLEVIIAADCRSGPGRNWSWVTKFLEGTTLIPSAITSFQPPWWYVAIPTTGGSCWIYDPNVMVTGEAGCVDVIGGSGNTPGPPAGGPTQTPDPRTRPRDNKNITPTKRSIVVTDEPIVVTDPPIVVTDPPIVVTDEPQPPPPYPGP